jgi:hypothetical protein
MAKESFFIRKKVDLANGSTTQTAIDLGFVVDALGKSVCRIHNISVQYGVGYVTSGQTTYASFEVGTQSAASLLGASDKSVISTGTFTQFEESGGGGLRMMSDALDLAPQHWTNGYLVGVDQLYLRGFAGNAQGDISIVLECTVETMGQSAAMALSLSQQ